MSEIVHREVDFRPCLPHVKYKALSQAHTSLKVVTQSLDWTLDTHCFAAISEGGGVWAEYLPKAALKSTDLFLMTSMCLYRSGWGAVATAQPSPLDRGRKFI